MARNCPYCGNPASSGDKFCNNCGRPLRLRSRSRAVAKILFQLREPEKFFLFLMAFTPLFAFPLSVRRAHDMGRPGWWAIVGILPIVGAALELCFRKVHWVDRWGDFSDHHRFHSL